MWAINHLCALFCLTGWLAWHSFSIVLSLSCTLCLLVCLSRPFSRRGSCRALPQHMTYTQLLDQSRPQHKLTCQIPKKTREAVSSQRIAFQHLICNAPNRTAGEAGGEAGGTNDQRGNGRAKSQYRTHTKKGSNKQKCFKAGRTSGHTMGGLTCYCKTTGEGSGM